MLEQGYIDQSEYDEALEDNVYDRIQIVNAQNASSSSTSYFVDALTEQEGLQGITMGCENRKDMIDGYC